MVKAILMDDAAFVHMIIKRALTQGRYNDSAEAQDGAEAVERYDEEESDVVIMNITMPNMDGLQALKKVKESDASAKIVMYVVMEQESMAVGVIKSGAKDFTIKSFNTERIVQIVDPILGK